MELEDEVVVTEQQLTVTIIKAVSSSSDALYTVFGRAHRELCFAFEVPSILHIASRACLTMLFTPCCSGVEQLLQSWDAIHVKSNNVMMAAPAKMHKD